MWSYPSGSSALFTGIAIAAVVSFALAFAISKAPPRVRPYIVGTVTFLAGLVYVLEWIWPRAQDRKPGEIPLNGTESVSFFLTDTVTAFKDLSNTLTAFLLLLGVFSLIRLHTTRVVKKQKDWSFSVVLLSCLFGIAAIGYWTFFLEQKATTALPVDPNSTPFVLRDLLFDGLLQGMDATMFSLIAFYILSAAYRAFRIRSVEATILLTSALLAMMSLLGLADGLWNTAIDGMGGKDAGSFLNNLRFSEIAGFMTQSLQNPGIRAIQFGIGVGALAMGLRLWLSLEKTGGTN